MKLSKLYFRVMALGSTCVYLERKQSMAVVWGRAWPAVESGTMLEGKAKWGDHYIPFSLDRSRLWEKLWQTYKMIAKLAKGWHHLDNRPEWWAKKPGKMLRKTRCKRTKKDLTREISQWQWRAKNQRKQKGTICGKGHCVQIWKHGFFPTQGPFPLPFPGTCPDAVGSRRCLPSGMSPLSLAISVLTNNHGRSSKICFGYTFLIYFSVIARVFPPYPRHDSPYLLQKNIHCHKNTHHPSLAQWALHKLATTLWKREVIQNYQKWLP